MKEQTAVEWLAEQLPTIDFIEDPYYEKILMRAKEIEHEQLYQNYLDGMRDESERE
jgi:hypothetical protein